MISSYDLAQMTQQQQMAMMQSMQYASQSNMAYVMGTVGQYGTGYIPPPTDLQLSNPIALPQMGFPYHHPNPGSFSYAGNQVGYGMGNQMSSILMRNMHSGYSAATLGVTGLGAYAGFRAAGLGGALKGGLMAGGLPLMAGGIAANYAFGNMAAGHQEQLGIYSNLGSNFNFINSSSRTGRGFSRNDAKAISDMTRELGAVPELLTSMGELNRIMNSISQMGVMQGVRNAHEVSRKFKESINTMHEIAKVMNTSIEGAVKFFGEAKMSGFYSTNAIRQNMAQRQFTSGLTGMNQDQINQLQFTGSQASFGMGGSRISGANLALRTARQIGVANEMGVLSNDRIMELTGESGAAGIQSMSEMLVGASYRMSQSSVGTALALAAGKQVNGRYTGEMDQDIVERVRSGNMSKSEMMSLARKKSASRNAKLSFASQRNKLIAETASSLGVEGISMELQNILGERGFNNPDAQNLVMQRFHVDERQASAVMEIMKNMPEIQRDISSKARTEGRRIAEQSYMNQNLSGEAIKRKIKKKFENIFEEPLKKLGADIGHSIESYVDNFMDDLMERHSVELSKSTKNDILQAMSSNTNAAQSISDIAASMKTIGAEGRFGPTDRLLSSLTDHNTENLSQANFLKSLPKSMVAKNGHLNYSQNAVQINQTKALLGNLSNGIFNTSRIDSSIKSKLWGLKDVGAAKQKYGKELSDLIDANNSSLGNMTNTEKLNFILGKMPDLDIETLAYLQKEGGLDKRLGAINFSKLGEERYGTSNLGNAKQLANELNSASEGLASAFHDSSGVRALLGSDTKARSLFLAATKGDKDALSLLRDDLDDKTKYRLTSKFGVSEGELGSLRQMYDSRNKNADLGKLTDSFENRLKRSSIGAALVQLQRSGIDMENRLNSADDAYGPGLLKGILGKFVGDLSSVDSKNLGSFLNSSDASIHEMLDRVGGLKGPEREKALQVLGSGATSAFNYSGQIAKRLKRKGGLDEVFKNSDEETQAFISKLRADGKFDDKDRASLVSHIRDKTFKGSLLTEGKTLGKDISGGKEMTDQLLAISKNAKDTADINRQYANLNNQFAQVITNVLGQDGKLPQQMNQMTKQLTAPEK